MRQSLTYLEGRSILISGAGGYLATNLIDLLKNVQCTIIRLTGRSELFSVEGNADIKDIHGNISRMETWEQALKGIDIVFHFAAQTSVYEAERNPQADFENNVLPILHLLEVCRLMKANPCVLFSSTVTISGIPTRLPVDETYPDNPETIYDLHKLMAEQYLRYYIHQGIVRGAALRLANVYGPGPKSSRSDRGILNQMVRKALAGETLTVYGKGDQIRDYIYIEDAVLAFLEAYRNIETINGKYFIIGSGQRHSIAQAVKLVADRVSLKRGMPVGINHIVPPSAQLPIEERNFVADSSRFIGVTTWKPRYSFIQGIDNTIEVLL